jgi:hypothetical protein
MSINGMVSYFNQGFCLVLERDKAHHQICTRLWPAMAKTISFAFGLMGCVPLKRLNAGKRHWFFPK